MEFGISKENLIYLFNNNRTDIIPSEDMSFGEKIDAASRFVGYAAALTFYRAPDSQSSLLLLIVFVFLRWLKKTSDVPQNEETIESEEVVENFEPKVVTKDCTQPIKKNPYMNPLMYENRAKAPACPIENKEIAQKADELFQGQVYKDIDDVWNRRTSSRQFYTMPSTTFPNNQKGFATWLYGNSNSRKKVE
mgnify:CR=1 FL=1